MLEEELGGSKAISGSFRAEDWSFLSRLYATEDNVVNATVWIRVLKSNYPNPRYTFGEFLIDGSGGSIRLYNDGQLTIQKLGEGETEHAYRHEDRNFSGDCCYTTQRHFIDRLIDGGEFETSGPNYLRSLAVQDAVYLSAERGLPVEVAAI